uniref:CCHC-type domain-containing protein n=1 Tax=Ditylum brightwellii TaxID=49249 RepID=A0A7S4RB82_9STRA|mmetsp:Transcript_42043/g.63455  ORF Transcript_42043/g.63455 Transcript_42043/m.63455 type:complete len:341 (+) Transcript_42043:238-1260(+)
MNDDDDDDDAISSSTLSSNNVVTAHHRHFKMYKPAKVLTQFKFTHRKRRNRTLLGDVITKDTLPSSGVMAIGRLDEDSEGLLLLTTDGKVSEQVRRKSVEKEYYVQLDGQITQEAIERLQRGVEISLPANNNKRRDDDDDDERSTCESTLTSPASMTYTTLPCKARILDTSIVTVENKTKEATKEEEQANQPSETEKKPKRKRRKFGGTCNRCKQAGHKAKDCSENPVDLFHTNNGNSSGDADSNNNNNAVQLALPAGIPPPSSSRAGYYNIRNTTSRRTSWISIAINEGKNRQVRRMTAAVGFPTLRLVRVKIGCVGLDGMVAGEVRELSQDVLNSIIT